MLEPLLIYCSEFTSDITLSEVNNSFSSNQSLFSKITCYLLVSYWRFICLSLRHVVSLAYLIRRQFIKNSTKKMDQASGSQLDVGGEFGATNRPGTSAEVANQSILSDQIDSQICFPATPATDAVFWSVVANKAECIAVNSYECNVLRSICDEKKTNHDVTQKKISGFHEAAKAEAIKLYDDLMGKNPGSNFDGSHAQLESEIKKCFSGISQDQEMGKRNSKDIETHIRSKS